MALENIITGPERVILDLKAKDQFAAIEELIDHLAEIRHIDPEVRDLIADAVREREETMSTGVGNGIGIPHAATPHVTDIVGAIGISEEGIEFESMDGEPVNLVMLFVVPEAHFQQHLDTLAQIARTLSRPERREALLDCAEAEEVVQILSEAGE